MVVVSYSLRPEIFDIRNLGSRNWASSRTSPAFAARTDVLLTKVCNSGQTYTYLLKLPIDFLPRWMSLASMSAYLKIADHPGGQSLPFQTGSKHVQTQNQLTASVNCPVLNLLVV